jgi:hypothetical protein
MGRFVPLHFLLYWDLPQQEEAEEVVIPFFESFYFKWVKLYYFHL